jgi:hypothetical protein
MVVTATAPVQLADTASPSHLHALKMARAPATSQHCKGAATRTLHGAPADRTVFPRLTGVLRIQADLCTLLPTPDIRRAGEVSRLRTRVHRSQKRAPYPLQSRCAIENDMPERSISGSRFCLSHPVGERFQPSDDSATEQPPDRSRWAPIHGFCAVGVGGRSRREDLTWRESRTATAWMKAIGETLVERL